jgi:hypothetical protein
MMQSRVSPNGSAMPMRGKSMTCRIASLLFLRVSDLASQLAVTDRLIREGLDGKS